MNQRPYTFPQSRSILAQADRACNDLPVLIKRGRGARVITIDGVMLHDFWLAGGRYPLGHAPAFLTQAHKNAVSLGGLGSYLRNDHIRLVRRLARRLPGYTIYFGRLDAAIPGAEILDLRKSAFTTSNTILPRGACPDIVLINGALWLDLIAVRDGFNRLPTAEELPDAPSVARADALLRKLGSANAPYAKIAEHIALFKAHAAPLLANNATAADGSFFPRVAMNNEKRIALLREGFLLSADGTIYFCAEHDPRAIIRLAHTLLDAP